MISARGVNVVAATAIAALIAAGGGSVWAQQNSSAASAPAPAQAPPIGVISGGVAALVNDDVISTYDLRQRALLFILTAGVPATPENMPQIQQEALRSLIDERLQLQELRRLEREQKFEIVADDDEVNEALASIAEDNNTTMEAMARQFSQVGLDLQTLRDQLRVQISWNRMITGRYGSRVRVGDSQISQMLQRLQATASQPRYQLSEIFIDAARAGGQDQAAEGARQLIAQIQQGAPFAPVARQFSSAPTAANGGDMGWVGAAELPPQLAAAVEQMRPGQMSEPIPVNDGVYILLLRDKRAGGGSTVVRLKQAAARVPQNAPPEQEEAARQKLAAFSASGATCDDLEARAASVGDLVAGDLGESDVNDLTPEFRTAATTLEIGQFSQPIRSPAGLHILMVCDRRVAEVQGPSRQEIENRLHNQQLAMLSRRYLRDLRNSATIETP